MNKMSSSVSSPDSRLVIVTAIPVTVPLLLLSIVLRLLAMLRIFLIVIITLIVLILII